MLVVGFRGAPIPLRVGPALLVGQAPLFCGAWARGLLARLGARECLGDERGETREGGCAVPELAAPLVGHHPEHAPGVDTVRELAEQARSLPLGEARTLPHVPPRLDAGGRAVHVLTAGAAGAARAKSDLLGGNGECHDA